MLHSPFTFVSRVTFDTSPVCSLKSPKFVSAMILMIIRNEEPERQHEPGSYIQWPWCAKSQRIVTPVRISPCGRAAWTPRTCERGNVTTFEFEYCWPWPLLPARCELMGHLPALQLVSTVDEIQAKSVTGGQSNTALTQSWFMSDCEKTPGPKTWRLKFVQ